MAAIDKVPEIIFTSDKVKGEAKKANIVLSESYQIPDSLIGMLITCPEMATFFANEKTHEQLVKVKEESKDPNNLFNIYLNNAVQDAQLSDDAKRIYLRDTTKQIELMSSMYDFDNNADFFKLALKFVSHGLHLLRVSGEEEEAQEAQMQEDELELGEEEEQNFKVFSSVIDTYKEAQDIIKEVEPSDLVAYMKTTFGRYDSFFTVHEFVKFVLRCLYQLSGDYNVDLNMALNVYLGLPIFNLRTKLRAEILAWALNRNWPDETDLDEDEPDNMRSVGVTLSKWAGKMIEIIKALHENDFDSVKVQEQTKFYNKIQSKKTGNLEWLYAPLVNADENIEGCQSDMSFVEVSKDIYLTTQSCEIRIISGNRLVEFTDVQMSHMEENKTNTTFKDWRKILCSRQGIPEGDYIVATPRSRKLCSFDFEDDITDVQFIGDRLFFYHCDGVRQNIMEKNMKPLFIQLSENLVLPVIFDGNKPVSEAIPQILTGLKAHQYSFTAETLKGALKFGLSPVNWDKTLDDFYKEEGEMQGGEEMNEGGAAVDIMSDENSKIGVMFRIENEYEDPAYKKEDIDVPQVFKLSVGELLKGVFVKSEENGDFSQNFIDSTYFAVDISNHSMKIDFTKEFTLNGEDFSDDEALKQVETKYEVSAFLIKSYGGYELFLKDVAEQTGENKFYSSNSGQSRNINSFNTPDKKACIVFYKKVK
jgi:hypothetical protein